MEKEKGLVTAKKKKKKKSNEYFCSLPSESNVPLLFPCSLQMATANSGRE